MVERSARGERFTRVVKVLIAVDDTVESVEAAALARRLFGADASGDQRVRARSGVEVARLDYDAPDGVGGGAAVPGPVESLAGSEVPELTEFDVAEREARDAVERAGLGEAQLIGDVGDPAAHAILDAAHEYGVDVVVVGSHERLAFALVLQVGVG